MAHVPLLAVCPLCLSEGVPSPRDRVSGCPAGSMAASLGQAGLGAVSAQGVGASEVKYARGCGAHVTQAGHLNRGELGDSHDNIAQVLLQRVSPTSHSSCHLVRGCL